MNFIKKNIILIVAFLLLLSYFVFSFYSNYKEIKQFNNDNLATRIRCENDIEYQNDFDYYCNSLTHEYHETDFFYNFYNLTSKYLSKIVYIVPLLLLIPALYNTSSYLKNRDNKKNNYKKVKSNLFKEAYKPILLYVLLFIGIIIATIIQSKGITSSYSIINKNSSIAVALWGEYYLYHPIVFIIMNVLTTLTHFIIYVNVGLLILRKHHDYLITIIVSYITILGMEIILEFGFNVIISKLILRKDYSDAFNIFNYSFFDCHNSIIAPLIVPLIILIISYVILYFAYKDKESLLVECERV